MRQIHTVCTFIFYSIYALNENLLGSKCSKFVKKKSALNILMWISQSMHNQYYGKHLTVKITKWLNSCNTDSSVLIFLQNMHCLTVKVC